MAIRKTIINIVKSLPAAEGQAAIARAGLDGEYTLERRFETTEKVSFRDLAAEGVKAEVFLSTPSLLIISIR